MEFDIHKIDCEDNILAQGLMGKAKAIFDGSDANSAVSQLCDGPNAIANCDRGIATHGWSQGAQIASLGEFSSASYLLFTVPDTAILTSLALFYIRRREL